MFKVSAATSASTYSFGSSYASASHIGAMDFDDDDPALAAASEGRTTVPGEGIASASSWMRGHGTYVENETVLANVAGTIERVNKLVSVRPLRSKYRPEVGDLVVGRITEVGPRRWRVDANGRQDAALLLSSINLPGGVQRRKLESDELQMRTYFQEGDLLVAEVQAIMGEGSMSLHTRSTKYGKLRNGRLVVVPPNLIVRLKSHFHTLSCGVDLILGMNGYIWVQSQAATSEESDTPALFDERGEAAASLAIYSSQNDNIDDIKRAAIDRVAVCIGVLAAHDIAITDTHVSTAYAFSIRLRDLDGDDVSTDKLCIPEFASAIAASVLTDSE